MKKLAILLLVLLTLILTTACGSNDSGKTGKINKNTPSDGPVPFVYGDANGDGKLSVLDATRIQRHLAGMTPSVAPEDMEKAIVSGRKELSVLDATLIQRRLVNLIKQFPVEENSADTETSAIQMYINETFVTVEWEDNETVAALQEAIKDASLTVETKNYEDFEQVGPLGMTLPQNDENMDTVAGDVVLFEGNHIVVFYGNNNWEYTRLGRITDKSAEELTKLLSGATATLTLLG